MKYGKKILAAALAALLALSVLTACAGGAISGTKLAKAVEGHLPWYESYAVKYDPTLNKTAKDAMNAVKAKVDGTTITMDNAIDYYKGTLLNGSGFTDLGKEGLKQTFKLDSDNSGKPVIVALVNAKGVKDEIAVIGAMAVKQTVTAQGGREPDYFRMGYYQDGNYVLVVFVGEGELPSTTPQSTPA